MVIIDVMTAEQLERKRGRRPKHPAAIMDAVILAVASTDKTIKDICAEFGVNYSTGKAWVHARRNELGNQSRADSPLINTPEELNAPISVDSTSATTTKDTDEKNGRTR